MVKSIARQSIGGRIGIGRRQIGGRNGQAVAQEPFSFPMSSASYSFTPPRSGYWKFVAWGPGGAMSNGVSAGGSGSYGEVTKFLAANSAMTVSVQLNTDTVLTFPDGSVCTAGKAALTVAGVALGFDYSLPGTAGVLTGGIPGNPGLGTGGGPGGAVSTGSGGAGAPGRLPYRGGCGATSYAGTGGGGEDGITNTHGQGHVLAVFVRD